MVRHQESITELSAQPCEEVRRRRRNWMSGLLIRRPQLVNRLAYFYARLWALSRAQRRRITRYAVGSLAGTALLLALSGSPAHAVTITVVNGEVVAASNGVCSLIEAIANANDTVNGWPHTDCVAGSPSGPDTISLPSGGVFSLTVADNILYGSTGLPVISSVVTIEGNGATIQRIGGDPFRLLSVATSGDLTIANVSLKNGLAEFDYGGGILAYGGLTVRDSTLTGNSADSGGAIFGYSGDITISGSQLMDNNAHSGSGLTIQFANVTINETTISGGRAEDGTGGGGIYLLNSTAEITDSTISGNSNEGGGGGLLAVSSTLNLVTSLVSGNEAPANYGGGLALYDSDVQIHRSTITQNNSPKGGGVYQYEGTTTLNQSLVARNDATTGGGILNERGMLKIINSTLSGNSAVSGGGAANLAAMTFDNVTVTGNHASGNGGGILNQGASGEMTLARSLIAGNTAGGQGPEVFHAGKAMAGGHFNLFGFNNNGGISGFTPGGNSFTPAIALPEVVNPTLADNGGPTRSHLLPAGSPAIDRSPSADCSSVPVGKVDQRGQPRNRDADDNPTGNECDIGAIEAPGTLAEEWTIFIPLSNQP